MIPYVPHTGLYYSTYIDPSPDYELIGLRFLYQGLTLSGNFDSVKYESNSRDSIILHVRKEDKNYYYKVPTYLLDTIGRYSDTDICRIIERDLKEALGV